MVLFSNLRTRNKILLNAHQIHRGNFTFDGWFCYLWQSSNILQHALKTQDSKNNCQKGKREKKQWLNTRWEHVCLKMWIVASSRSKISCLSGFVEWASMPYNLYPNTILPSLLVLKLPLLFKRWLTCVGFKNSVAESTSPLHIGTLRTYNNICKAQQGKWVRLGWWKVIPPDGFLATSGKQHESTHQEEVLASIRELKPQVLDSFMTGKDIRLTFTILSEHLFKNVDSGIQYFHLWSIESRFHRLREAWEFEFKQAFHFIFLHVRLADFCVLCLHSPHPYYSHSILTFPLLYPHFLGRSASSWELHYQVRIIENRGERKGSA